MRSFIANVWCFLGEYWEAIVALAALALTVWELHASRRHNRLSVRPELVTQVQASEEEMFFEVRLHNAGLGPARIKHFCFTFNGEDLPSLDVHKLITALRPRMPAMENQIDVDLVRENYVLAQGAGTTVIRVNFRNVEPSKVPAILHSLNAIDVRVEYESLYGEKFRIDQAQPGGG